MENWLHKQADLKPNQLALIAENKQYTFAQLEQIVIKRAQQFVVKTPTRRLSSKIVINC